MAKRIVCIITGKTSSIGDDYYDRKVKEFGGEDLLNERYVCKQAKTLLLRGYGIDEIRSMLKSSTNTDINPSTIDWIKNNDKDQVFNGGESSTSDPKVAKFINDIKNNKL